jgi:hypothetical protein
MTLTNMLYDIRQLFSVVRSETVLQTNLASRGLRTRVLVCRRAYSVTGRSIKVRVSRLTSCLSYGEVFHIN